MSKYVLTFAPHGDIHVEFDLKNNAVVNRPSSSYNQEGIELLFDHIFLDVQKHRLDHWVLVELLSVDACVTPNAKSTLAAMYKKSLDNGCDYICAVCSTQLQIGFLEDAANLAGIDITFYDSALGCFENIEKNR